MACKRCGGEGMGGYKHVAAGVCFECGKLPGGGAATEAMRLTARQRIIARFHNALLAAAQHATAGTLRQWWADVSRDDEHGPGLLTYLTSAPADVQARAVAAFGRLGISI